MNQNTNKYYMYPNLVYIYIFIFAVVKLLQKKHCEIKFTCLFYIGSQTWQQLAPADARCL